MTSTPLSYWEPGSEERKLRIFISHRYENDDELYEKVRRALNSQGFDVQDVSLSAKEQMSGPRGGDLPKLEIQANIAARIYTSDILIAPSRVGAGRSDVDHDEDQQRRTALVSEVAAVGVPHAVCGRVSHEIVPNVIKLVGGRPNWTMRQGENDTVIRYRGPLPAARDDVLRKFPFEARLAGFTPPPPERKKGIWPFS